MATQFEYIVAQAQSSRVTYVNGAWQGTLDSQEEQALESCPRTWDYLHEVGRNGWELVAATNDAQSHLTRQVLFFKRKANW